DSEGASAGGASAMNANERAASTAVNRAGESGPISSNAAPAALPNDRNVAEDAPRQDVPATAHCAAVADWNPDWSDFEERVLELVNEARAAPADCGSEGKFAAAAPLAMDPVLRCSARLHSLDMYERNYFDHTDPDGQNPFQRMRAAGFRGSKAGENIAVGQATPEQVMQSWMASDGHCANVMQSGYRLLGVGYDPGAGGRGLGSNYWTQNFGAPLN
ncbi:MAG TPA: CAP domain-containing protein, partial [Polyangiaceae bacterium]|nr:CAP domain-containing protein [Polyangiaceae bacterium]